MNIRNRALIALLAASLSLAAEPLASIRAWQFHSRNIPYVLAGMRLAPHYDVNTVVFSHELIGYASELFNGSDRGRELTQLTDAAHAENLKAWIWVREFQDVPERFLSNGVVQMDRPGFWEWVAERYNHLFTAYPNFDGLMLTFEDRHTRFSTRRK